ncbi:MAG: hypothetical protein ACRDV9_04725 [Acidimicrobiia bacterium]
MTQTREAPRIERAVRPKPSAAPKLFRLPRTWVILVMVLVPAVMTAGFIAASRLADEPPFDYVSASGPMPPVVPSPFHEMRADARDITELVTP